MTKISFIVLLIFLSSTSQCFSKTSNVYEYWLDNFLIKKINENTTDKITKNLITLHLKEKLKNYKNTKITLEKFSQAEFSQPEKYFKKEILNTKTIFGKKLKIKLENELKNIEREFGVDRNILLAIWANETFFGKAGPSFDGLQILSLLSFSSNKRNFFLKEFLNLIKISEKYKIDIETLKTSTSGALGQPQFLPSTFLKYGVDFDDDGVVNIWDSEADTLASIANYLSKLGWNDEREWGFEVKIPRSIKCHLEGPDHSRTLLQWEKLGLVRVSGKPFPEKDKAQSYNLLFPSGTLGPIYLVSNNFYVLKQYNNSDLYALSVGFLADKLKYKNHNFYTEWQDTKKINKNDIIKLQKKLSKNHDVGGIDGLVGYKTRRAIGLYQKENNIKQTCWP